jgi:hypothetical protein
MSDVRAVPGSQYKEGSSQNGRAHPRKYSSTQSAIRVRVTFIQHYFSNTPDVQRQHVGNVPSRAPDEMSDQDIEVASSKRRRRPRGN